MAITEGVGGAALGVGLTIVGRVGSSVAVGTGAEGLAAVGIRAACDSLVGVGSVVDVAFAGVPIRVTGTNSLVSGERVALATAVAGGVARGRSAGC